MPHLLGIVVAFTDSAALVYSYLCGFVVEHSSIILKKKRIGGRTVTVHIYTHFKQTVESFFLQDGIGSQMPIFFLNFLMLV